MKSKRNGEIDILRFVFASIIMVYHFNQVTNKGLFISGFIGVEFFFLVSGYFLAKAAMETEYNQHTLEGKTVRYTLHKASGFVYYYFIAMLFNLIETFVLKSEYTIKNAADSIARSLPHMTLTATAIGYQSPLYIMDMWYLSAMLVSVFILYPVIVKWKNTALVLIFPVLILFGSGWILNVNGRLATDVFKYQGIMCAGQMRGIIEMMAGASVYKIVNVLRHYHFGRSAKILLFIIKWGAYAIVLYYAGGYTNKNFDIHALGYLCIGVSISLSQITHTIRGNRMTEWLARVSLPLYIFAPLVIRLLDYLHGENVSTEMLFAFMGGAYLLSIAMLYLTPMIRKACENVWKRLDIYRIAI